MTVATDPRKTGIAAGMTLLAASAVAASVTGTVNETTLATVTIPGGAMGTGGGIRVELVFSFTNSANTKTLRAAYGGSNFLTQTPTTVASGRYIASLRNRGSASAQVGAAAANQGVGTGTGAVTVLAVNSAVDQALTISGQLALAGEMITLESYEVWLLP